MCSAQGWLCLLSSRSVPWGLGTGEANYIIPVFLILWSLRMTNLRVVFLHGIVGFSLDDGRDHKNPSNPTRAKMSVCFGNIIRLHTEDLAWKLSISTTLS